MKINDNNLRNVNVTDMDSNYTIDRNSSKNKVGKGIVRTLMGALTFVVTGVGIVHFTGCKKDTKDVSNEVDVTPEALGYSSNVVNTPVSTPVPTQTPSIESKKEKLFNMLSLIEEKEGTLGKEDESVLSLEKDMLVLAKELEEYLDDYEKARVLVVLDDNYARGMNQVEGLSLSEEEGLVALSYLNGIKANITEANTEDVTLDFILDFETYWNKLNYDAKKYLQSNREVKYENYAKYGDLVSDYVLNSKDAMVLKSMIGKRLEVNNYVHDGKYEEAYNLAVKLIEEDVKMYVCNCDMSVGNDKVNVSTLSPWAQYLVSYIAYADTSYVRDDTLITTINGCEITNGSHKEKAYHYDADYAFVQQDSARNNINWYLEANSINATMAFVYENKKLCK